MLLLYFSIFISIFLISSLFSRGNIVEDQNTDS